MVAYNIPVPRARDVIYGVKCSVLKPFGKRPHVATGGVVHVFCGAVPPDFFKAAGCHRLIEAPCTRSEPVVIDARGFHMAGRAQDNPEWVRLVARSEGYASFAELQAAYDRLYGFPWHGQLIRWDPLRADFRAQWPLIEKPPDATPDDTKWRP